MALGHRERLIDGDEWDALTRGGKRVRHWCAGLRAAVETKRVRRQAKAQITEMGREVLAIDGG